jgi:2-polyprenyl-3-methyl-5-hydroxy-6-metoxy-1,4-benzoquinol methylase
MPSPEEDGVENMATEWLIRSGWHNMQTGELLPGFPIGRSDIVVDVGCGDGGASLFAVRQGAEVVAIDIDPATIERLGQRMREEQEQLGPNIQRRSCRAVVSDCNPIPLPDGYATTVLAMEVLEHVDDPRAFLAELARIGKPGARYFLSVPHALSEAVQRKIAPASYWAKPNHLRVFEQDELQDLVQAAGLTVQRRFSVGFYWLIWWSLFWAAGVKNVPFGKSGGSPLLKNWNKTCKCLLDAPGAKHVLQALEETLPHSQVIFACKPG